MPTTLPPVPHYDRPGTIQPITFMEASFPPEQYVGFLRGNVLKYLCRFDHKGTPDADLKKAAQYLEWLREAVAVGPVKEAE
jgi:hypothetical protein